MLRVGMSRAGPGEWEYNPHTPGVLVRAASKGLAGCGTGKSVRKMGGGVKCAAMWKNVPDCPRFFVSVASMGLSQAVSLLPATLAGRSISVAAKGLMGAKCGRQVTTWAG